MFIYPGQESISWNHFEHFVGALTLLMGLDAKDALELAFNDLMQAHIGIHCDLFEHAKHTEAITEESLAAIRHLGGL
jgi:hypothetical protein